jgi:hypothetical protein
MKRFVLFSMILTALLVWNGRAAAYDDLTLKEIAEGIDAYKGKTLTLKLKYKMMDRLAAKIHFYDKRNYIWEFDVAFMLKDEAFVNMMLNAREGVEYLVTFEVVRLGSLGYVVGTLKKFTPVALEKLPEGGR